MRTAASLFFLPMGLVLGGVLNNIHTMQDDDSVESFKSFQEWQAHNQKLYDSIDEVKSRYEIYVENMKKAKEMNSKRQHNDSASFGPTKFADMTNEEFRRKVLSTFMVSKNPTVKRVHGRTRRDTAPEQFDWTKTPGVVHDVRAQGDAGSCWAFAGLANVEGQYARLTGRQSPALSVQSVVDCNDYDNPLTGEQTCGLAGATMGAFYEWLMAEGGVVAEKDYPYCSGNLACRPCPLFSIHGCDQSWIEYMYPYCDMIDSCPAKYNTSKFVPGVKVTDYSFFEQDEHQILYALWERGPLVAALAAPDLQFYYGGILEPSWCDPEMLDHAVLLVGYGQDGEDLFWKAKNSWGTDWGEDGYFRIQRGVGACGIDKDVSTAQLDAVAAESAGS